MVVGNVYIFLKSGNLVRALNPTGYGGAGNCVVERVDGQSVGKQMIVGGHSLVASLED